MAKRKKSKSENLSHEEIWDDSALVRSWDEAVEEYNLYHSIHARGEDVEEILNRAERDGVDAVAAIEKDDESMDIEGAADTAAENQNTAASTDILQDEYVPPNAANAVPPPASVPDALLGQAQDPALKNLMMAWYYAGYYTGLYEGQRQPAPNNNFATRQ